MNGELLPIAVPWEGRRGEGADFLLRFQDEAIVEETSAERSIPIELGKRLGVCRAKGADGCWGTFQIEEGSDDTALGR